MYERGTFPFLAFENAYLRTLYTGRSALVVLGFNMWCYTFNTTQGNTLLLSYILQRRVLNKASAVNAAVTPGSLSPLTVVSILSRYLVMLGRVRRLC